MTPEISQIGERLQHSGLGLKEALAVMGMAMADDWTPGMGHPPNQMFEDLYQLMDRTVHGARIERFRPKEGKRSRFHAFEIHTEEGDVLGHLHMIYFRKPIPCYYLVYVEILGPFRGRGLGNRILTAFRRFAEEKGAVGLLDNIIPPEDPTYDIYLKLGWRAVDEVMGVHVGRQEENYMLFVPENLTVPELRGKLIRLLYNLRKKRPVLEMQDNEVMVRRTIEQFRAVQESLLQLFGPELSKGHATPVMRFMFTNFITKWLGFSRRISELLGYTGGESLAQLVISERVKSLAIQPYALWSDDGSEPRLWGDGGVIRRLPEGLRKDPTTSIEDLPLYRRPFLLDRLREPGGTGPRAWTISDLLDLGFDPTKLRELDIEGEPFIAERLSPRFLPELEQRAGLLRAMAGGAHGLRLRGAALLVNPPVVFIQDKGNGYLIRKKVEGIHWEEAVDQLRSRPHLQGMNSAAGIDRAILATVRAIREWIAQDSAPALRPHAEDLACFVPWDLERNYPRVMVDPSGVSLEAVWIA